MKANISTIVFLICKSPKSFVNLDEYLYTVNATDGEYVHVFKQIMH